MTCVISVFTLRTWVPCFSAAQTLRGVFNVATRGTELASLARTLTKLGRLQTSTITRVDFVNRSWTFLRERSNILFSLLRRPQTRRSRKASFRWVPNWQVEARCFRLAANAVTLSPSRCVQLWNRYLSAITSFFGAKWFFRIVVSCAYVFSEGLGANNRNKDCSSFVRLCRVGGNAVCHEILFQSLQVAIDACSSWIELLYFAEAWHGRSISRRQKCYVLGQADNCTQIADQIKNCINHRAHGFYSNRIHTADSVWITDTITNVMIRYNKNKH